MTRSTPRLYNTRLPKRGSVNLVSGRWVVNANPDLAAYEQAICSGKIACPYTSEHKDHAGQVVATGPIPLTKTGRLKIDIFRDPEAIRARTPQPQPEIEQPGKAA